MCAPKPPKAPPPEPTRKPRYLLSRDQFEELGGSVGQLSAGEQVLNNIRQQSGAGSGQLPQNAGLGISRETGAGGLQP